MKDVTVISDPGVDDMVALVLLDKLLAPRQPKTLVSTFGNNAATITAANARDFAAYMQNGWQYREGASLPLSGTVERPWADYFHGSDGLWGVRPPRGSGSVSIAKNTPADTILSLGPLTELTTFQTIQRVVIMGGTFRLPGNETDCTEFNVAMDPDAAKQFFANCRGGKVQLVPMDATQQVTWSLTDVLSIPDTSPLNIWLKQLLLTWFAKYTDARAKNFVLYDPLAVYVAFFPEAAVWKRSGVLVVDSGPERGRTIFVTDNPPCDIALHIKDPKQVARHIFALIFEGQTNE